MALQKQLKDIPITSGGGLNLRSDPIQLPPGALTTADDIMFNQDGVLQARPGLASTTANGVSGSLTSIFYTKEGNIGAVSQSAMGRGGPSITHPTLQPSYGRSPQIPLHLGSNGYVEPSNLTYAPYNANIGGTNYACLMVAWDYALDQGSSGPLRVTYYGIWNTVTSLWVTQPTALANSGTWTADIGTGTIVGIGAPVLIPNDNSAYSSAGYMVVSVQYTNGGNSYTQLGLVNILSPGTPVKFTGTQIGPLAGSLYTLPSVAVSQYTTKTAGGGKSYVAWSPMTGATNAILFSVLSGVIANVGSAPGTIGQTRPITICLDQQTVSGTVSRIFMSDGQNHTVWAQGGTNTGAAATGLGNLTNPGLVCNTDYTNNNRFIVAAVRTTAVPTSDIQWATVPSAGGAATSQGSFTPLSAGTWTCASQIFYTQDGRPCVWVCYNGNSTSTQHTFVCFDLQNKTIIGRAAYLAANPTCQNAPWIGYPTGDVNVMQAIFLVRGTLVNSGYTVLHSGATSQNDAASPQLNIFTFNWGATSTLELPQGTLTSGMAPVFLTNTTAYELGFSWYPELKTSQLTVNAGGSLTGVYSYALAYQYIDEYNNVHWSALSPVAAQVTCSSSNVTFTGVPFSATDKGNAYLFRTTAGGSIYYQLAPLPTAYAGYFTDNTADSALSAQTAYTTGGEAPNDPPPPCSIIAASSTRVFAVAAEDPTKLYYSKPFRTGRPVEWVASQFLYVTPNTGPITALAVLDDKLIIFKASNIYVLVDNAPTSVPSPQFAGPFPVPALSGAISQTGIVVCNLGVFYQSQRGLELLGRDLQSSVYIGYQLDGGVGTLSSSCVVPYFSQVRFLDTTNACAWVFDINQKAWSKFNYPFAGSAMMAGTPTGIIYYTPIYGFAVENGANYTFGDYTSQQPTVTYRPVIETGWIPVAQTVVGFGRLYRMGLLGRIRSNLATAPTIEIAYDYAAAYTDMLSPSITGTVGQPFQVRSRVPRQKMEAVRFRITWQNGVTIGVPNVYTDTLALAGIELEYGMYPGTYKLPAAQSV